VNIGSNQPRAQYLRLKLSLELPEAGLAAQIQPVMPRVLDTLQVFLREMRPSDFEGSASVHRMKEELTRRVNLAIQPARIDAVLFREILIQ
jgi:flagellar FliL protein